MSAFSAMDIGRSGVGFSHMWMDTIAHNVANVNTVRATDEEPFRSQMIVAQENARTGDAGGGVRAGALLESEVPAQIVHDPDHPLADAQGNVAHASVDLSTQMSDMVIANRSYQANLRTIQSAREAYEAALRLGQSR